MSRSTMGWRNWLLAVVGLAVVGNILWKLSPWAFGVFAAIVAFVAVRTLNERRRAQKLGYWFEHLSPGQLRGKADEIAVVYHEGDNQLVFNGIQRRRPNRNLIYVPHAEEWDAAMEPWAKGRRSEIVERLRGEKIMEAHDIVDRQKP